MGKRSHILADELSAHIRERILDGEYPPGASVTETGVATEYGVARPTARSALDRLVYDDLLVRHAHAALRVKQVSPDEIPLVLALLEFFESRALGLVLAEPRDLRELRSACGGRLHKFLHTFVSAGGSEQLTRFHKQSTFALLLGSRHLSLEPLDAPAETMTRLAEALFVSAADAAGAALAALQDHRRRSVVGLRTDPDGASAPGNLLA